MSSLSASSMTFWEDVVGSAQMYYQRWLSASPVERLHIQASALVHRYRQGRYARVDQRAVSLLIASIGAELKEDIISLRLLGSGAIIFKIMCRYQPGGSSENQSYLPTWSTLKEHLPMPLRSKASGNGGDGCREQRN